MGNRDFNDGVITSSTHQRALERIRAKRQAIEILKSSSSVWSQRRLDEKDFLEKSNRFASLRNARIKLQAKTLVDQVQAAEFSTKPLDGEVNLLLTKCLVAAMLQKEKEERFQRLLDPQTADTTRNSGAQDPACLIPRPSAAPTATSWGDATIAPPAYDSNVPYRDGGGANQAAMNSGNGWVSAPSANGSVSIVSTAVPVGQAGATAYNSQQQQLVVLQDGSYAVLQRLPPLPAPHRRTVSVPPTSSSQSLLLQVVKADEYDDGDEYDGYGASGSYRHCVDDRQWAYAHQRRPPSRPPSPPPRGGRDAAERSDEGGNGVEAETEHRSRSHRTAARHRGGSVVYAGVSPVRNRSGSGRSPERTRHDMSRTDDLSPPPRGGEREREREKGRTTRKYRSMTSDLYENEGISPHRQGSRVRGNENGGDGPRESSQSYRAGADEARLTRPPPGSRELFPSREEGETMGRSPSGISRVSEPLAQRTSGNGQLGRNGTNTTLRANAPRTSIGDEVLHVLKTEKKLALTVAAAVAADPVSPGRDASNACSMQSISTPSRAPGVGGRFSLEPAESASCWGGACSSGEADGRLSGPHSSSQRHASGDGRGSSLQSQTHPLDSLNSAGLQGWNLTLGGSHPGSSQGTSPVPPMFSQSREVRNSLGNLPPAQLLEILDEALEDVDNDDTSSFAESSAFTAADRTPPEMAADETPPSPSIRDHDHGHGQSQPSISISSSDRVAGQMTRSSASSISLAAAPHCSPSIVTGTAVAVTSALQRQHVGESSPARGEGPVSVPSGFVGSTSRGPSSHPNHRSFSPAFSMPDAGRTSLSSSSSLSMSGVVSLAASVERKRSSKPRDYAPSPSATTSGRFSVPDPASSSSAVGAAPATAATVTASQPLPHLSPPRGPVNPAGSSRSLRMPNASFKERRDHLDDKPAIASPATYDLSSSPSLSLAPARDYGSGSGFGSTEQSGESPIKQSVWPTSGGRSDWENRAGNALEVQNRLHGKRDGEGSAIAIRAASSPTAESETSDYCSSNNDVSPGVLGSLQAPSPSGVSPNKILDSVPRQLKEIPISPRMESASPTWNEGAEGQAVGLRNGGVGSVDSKKYDDDGLEEDYDDGFPLGPSLFPGTSLNLSVVSSASGRKNFSRNSSLLSSPTGSEAYAPQSGSLSNTRSPKTSNRQIISTHENSTFLADSSHAMSGKPVRSTSPKRSCPSSLSGLNSSNPLRPASPPYPTSSQGDDSATFLSLGVSRSKPSSVLLSMGAGDARLPAAATQTAHLLASEYPSDGFVPPHVGSSTALAFGGNNGLRNVGGLIAGFPAGRFPEDDSETDEFSETTGSRSDSAMAARKAPALPKQRLLLDALLTATASNLSLDGGGSDRPSPAFSSSPQPRLSPTSPSLASSSPWLAGGNRTTSSRNDADASISALSHPAPLIGGSSGGVSPATAPPRSKSNSGGLMGALSLGLGMLGKKKRESQSGTPSVSAADDVQPPSPPDTSISRRSSSPGSQSEPLRRQSSSGKKGRPFFGRTVSTGGKAVAAAVVPTASNTAPYGTAETKSSSFLKTLSGGGLKTLFGKGMSKDSNTPFLQNLAVDSLTPSESKVSTEDNDNAVVIAGRGTAKHAPVSQMANQSGDKESSILAGSGVEPRPVAGSNLQTPVTAAKLGATQSQNESGSGPWRGESETSQGAVDGWPAPPALFAMTAQSTTPNLMTKLGAAGALGVGGRAAEVTHHYEPPINTVANQGGDAHKHVLGTGGLQGTAFHSAGLASPTSGPASSNTHHLRGGGGAGARASSIIKKAVSQSVDFDSDDFDEDPGSGFGGGGGFIGAGIRTAVNSGQKLLTEGGVKFSGGSADPSRNRGRLDFSGGSLGMSGGSTRHWTQAMDDEEFDF